MINSSNLEQLSNGDKKHDITKCGSLNHCGQ